MKKNMRRILALILALAMTASVCCVSVFAAAKDHTKEPMILVGGLSNYSPDSKLGNIVGHYMGAEDAAIVATHMMLEAKAQGVDSCWVNFFHSAPVKAAAGIPDKEKVIMLLDLGYPAEGAGPLANHTKRKPLEDTVKIIK